MAGNHLAAADDDHLVHVALDQHVAIPIPAETTEAFLEGHIRAFAYFGGPNQFRYPRRPRYFVKQKSGGLLLLRRITPLPRRNTVYFCSGAYSRFTESPIRSFLLVGKWVTPPQHTTLSAPVLVLHCKPGHYSWSLWDGTYREDLSGKRRGQLLEVWIATGAVLDGATSVPIEYRLDDQKLQRGNMSRTHDPTTASFQHVDLYTIRLPKLLFGRDVWRKEGETYQTHKALLGMPEYQAAEFVMQFDFPDVTQVADDCGLTEHNRK